MIPSLKPQSLPQLQRRPSKAKFILTERDTEILNALGRYRYLRTSQISRLIFPQNSTLQSARRRLKYLYHHGYVGRIQPMVQVGHGDGEMAYYLEKVGRTLLDDDTLPNYSHKSQVKQIFLQHALDVSEFYLNLELSAKALPNIELHRIITDFELKSHTHNAIGKHRYRLFDEVQDPIGKRKIVVHPDLMFILRSEGKNSKIYKRLYFVEIDRGTEGLRVLRDKFTGYHLYKREGIFKKFGDFDDFRVLVQTNSEKRMGNIVDLAGEFEEVVEVWVGYEIAISTNDILTDGIWMVGSCRKQIVGGEIQKK